MFQWLELCTLTNEGPGPIPGWGTKIPQAAQSGGQKKEKKKKENSSKSGFLPQVEYYS